MQYGFIGTGNMGGALAKALCREVNPAEVYLANRTEQKAQALAAELGANVAVNSEIAQRCDVIFLGVKPQMMAQMLSPLQSILQARQPKPLLVSMAAGLTADSIEAMAGGDFAVVRIMPNIACAVGQSMTLLCRNDKVTQAQLTSLQQALRKAGVIDELPESLIDAAGAIAGCGGAYVCLFLEALADGGVACGLPREKAQLYALQMLKGHAELIQSGRKHTAAWKDAICSPAGSTIAGVRVLEKGSFRSTVTEAVIAAYKKNLELKG